MGLRKKSAKKRIKTSAKRRDRNLKTKEAIKKALKAAEKAIIKKANEAKDLVKQAISLLDKASQRGIVHRNKTARKKSRLLKKLNKSAK